MSRLSRALASPAIPYLLTAAFIALGVMVSLKTPLYQGLDEGWHYAYVEHYALGRPLPDLNKHFTTGDVAAPYWQTHEASQPPLYYMLMGRLAALVPRGNLMEEQVLAQGGVPNGMYGNFLPADEGGLGTGHVLAGRLARFATVLMGAVAVLCSYFIALWLTRRYEVAVLTTALMAFNPRNLVLSGAISNDMAVACLAALTLLLATRVVTAERKPGLGLIFLMGLSAGAALMTKYSGGAVIFAAIAALIGRMIHSRYSLRWLAINGAALAAGVLLVSGPFFVHNWQLYGDVLAWNKVNEMNAALPAPRTLQDALGWLPHILKTYFAHPAYMSPLPNRYNELMLVALLVGLAGSAWLLARRKLGLAYWPLLAAFLVNAVTYLSWFRLRDATQSMRFFSPTFIPITLLVALGWLVFIPRRWQAGFVVMVTVTYGLFTSLTLYESMGHIYAFPRYVSEGEARDLLSRPSAGRVAFENGIELLDVQLKNQRVDPGSPVELSIVWRTTAPLTVSAHLVLDARDGRGRTAASLNTANMVRYSYIPRAWQIGRPLRRRLRIRARRQWRSGEYIRRLAAGRRRVGPTGELRVHQRRDRAGESPRRRRLRRRVHHAPGPAGRIGRPDLGQVRGRRSGPGLARDRRAAEEPHRLRTRPGRARGHGRSTRRAVRSLGGILESGRNIRAAHRGAGPVPGACHPGGRIRS